MKKRKLNDLLPDDVIKFRKLEASFVQKCDQFGYQEIKTSSLEPLYLFTVNNALAPDVLKSVYSFLDWGGWSGERVALRPDLTISAIRYYLDYLKNDQKSRIYYVENLFLLDETGKELSERWQFGIENIGDASYIADVEAIFLAVDILRSAGFEDLYLILSFPAIILECLKVAFYKESERQDALRLIRQYRFNEIGMGDDNQSVEILKRLLSFKGTSVSFLNNLKSDFSGNNSICGFIDRFSSIVLALDALSCRYEINFSLSKDIEYYTGIQFQILSEHYRRAYNVLCSGGRYDNLIRNLGKLNEDVPAVGFALYTRNIINMMDSPKERLQNIGIVIKNVTYKNIRTAQGLCNRFNRIGFSAQIIMHGIPESEFTDFGLIIEVDQDIYNDGYNIIHSHQIDKPLLKNIFKKEVCTGE